VKTTTRPVTLVAAATLSTLVLTGCSGADAQAVEDHHAVCVDETTGTYVDPAQCGVLDDDGDLDDYDDFEENAGGVTASGVVLGFVAASLLKGKTPALGQKAPAYARAIPAGANLVTPAGVLAPGSGDKDGHKAKKSTSKATPSKVPPAPAKTTAAKSEKKSIWKKSSTPKKSSSSRRSGKR
jgi:hypothetical protein